MAGITPSFVTGAKAIVKIYDKTVAFCSDVSYNVSVEHVPIESLGIFEIISHEPVAYTVNGSFSVVRYAGTDANLQNFAAAQGAQELANANGASNIGDGTNSIKQHVDPRQILASTTFDLEVLQKQIAGNANAPAGFFRLADCRITNRASSLNKRGVLIDNYQFVGRLAEDDFTVDDQVGGSATQTP